MKAKLLLILALFFSVIAYAQKKVDAKQYVEMVRLSRTEPETALKKISELKKDVTVKDSIYVFLLLTSAELNHNTNHFNDLITDLTEVMALEPTNEKEYRRGIAQAHRYMGNHKAYLENYQRILELDPNDELAYSNMANLYIYIKQYDKALEILNRNPNKQRYEVDYLRYAQAYYGQGKFKEAAENIERYFALTEDPKADHIALKYTALIYKNLGDATKSCEYIRQSASAIEDGHLTEYYASQDERMKATTLFKERLAELDEIAILAKTLCR